jgi:adenosine kinase
MPKLLGMGNPLLDICADVPMEFLEKYGLKLNDAILAEDKHKDIFAEMVEKFPVQYIAGGATQNSIRVAQWMLQEAGATAYFGAIGKGDKFGEQLKASATADGVAVHYYETEEAPTGTCAALIHDNERSLCTKLDAANCYKIEHFESEEIKKVWSTVDFAYSAGFFLTVSPPTIMAMAKHCAENNKVFSMNLSAPFICEFFKEPQMAALPYCDIIFGNESEAEAFGKAQGYDDTSVAAVALKLAALDKVNTKRSRMVLITQGSDSTIFAQDGKVTEFAVTPIAKEEILDTNGAGDAFVGGFMAALVKGKEIKDCVEAGHYASGVILRVSGTVLNGKPAMTL